MHVILAGDGAGVVDALQSSPWYVHLAAAAGLGLGAYGLHVFADRKSIESDLLEIICLFLAIAAFYLAMQGIFGSN